MAFPGQFYKGYLQFAREAVWATAVAADHRIPFLDVVPDRRLDLIRSETMDGSGFCVAYFGGAKRVRVTLDVYLTYTGLLLLLDAAFGTATFGANGGTTAGAGPYTHTFRQKDLFNSFTLQVGMGDVPSGRVERMFGAKVEEIVITGRERELCRARITFVGKDYETNIVPTGALTSPALDPVRFSDITVFADGVSESPNLLNFELALKNNLHMERQLTSGQLIDEPIKNDFPDATLKFTEEFTSRTALENQYALTQGAPSITVASGALGMALSMANGYLEPIGRAHEGKGRITQALSWRPIKDANATYVQMTVTNNTPTINT